MEISTCKLQNWECSTDTDVLYLWDDLLNVQKYTSYLDMIQKPSFSFVYEEIWGYKVQNDFWNYGIFLLHTIISKVHYKASGYRRGWPFKSSMGVVPMVVL